MNNKENRIKKYVVVVFDWINGVLTKTKNVFSSLNEAETFVDEQTDGEIKLYNSENQIIRSENKQIKFAKVKKDKPGRNDDDDDDYN